MYSVNSGHGLGVIWVKSPVSPPTIEQFTPLIHRQRPIKREDAVNAVNQIYLELLGRESLNDPGAVPYVDCLVDRSCDVDSIRTEILQSPEFRTVQENRATREREQAQEQAAGEAADGIPSTIAGIPLAYIIGGVGALLLLRKKR